MKIDRILPFSFYFQMTPKIYECVSEPKHRKCDFKRENKLKSGISDVVELLFVPDCRTSDSR